MRKNWCRVLQSCVLALPIFFVGWKSRDGFGTKLNAETVGPRVVDSDATHDDRTIHKTLLDFCVGWDIDMDYWWTHHPEWTVSLENDTHCCFSHIREPKKAAFFRRLYYIQFSSDCSNSQTTEMASAGWGADFLAVQEGLLYALENKVPVQVYPRQGRWHYAAKKDASHPVCPQKDMSCYFLNITSCPPNDIVGHLQANEDAAIKHRHGSWANEYATRPKTWLRRKVYKLASSLQITSPCTVMHVRRSDVVLHHEVDKIRRYHAIQEYVDAAGNLTNILLLTDDQNAIEEATAMFPQYNWMYLDRPRYRGNEGGYEQQVPSDDPEFEVVVILAIFRLVQQCDTFVYSRSRFASQISHYMKGAREINIDANHEVFDRNHAATVNISRPFP